MFGSPLSKANQIRISVNLVYVYIYLFGHFMGFLGHLNKFCH